MFENQRIAAYGDAQGWIDCLNPRDIVFYSHRWQGLIAAAEVAGPARNDDPDERYRSVRFLTPIPQRSTGIVKSLTFGDVVKVLAKNFYWARTVKVPYLSRNEAQVLLAELRAALA